LNPIPIAASLVCELDRLHHVLAKEDGSLISVCELKSGFCSNVIPGSATIRGTFRTFDIGNLRRIETLLRESVDTIAAQAKCEIRSQFDSRYDTPLRNSENAFQLVRDLASTCLPHGYWIEATEATRGMEDFAFYTAACGEGAMFWLGTGKSCPSLHNPGFDFPDEVLEWGILMFCLIALAS
jgi:metal-dependent amidase/aminoacylase/carboxypeptidase family protein